MFPTERQKRLTPILQRLHAIPGVKNVTQDDWDSQGINVFLNLNYSCMTGMMGGFFPREFISPIRSVKTAILKTCRGVPIRFLDQPTRRYYSDDGEKRFDGYTHGSIKIEVGV